MLICGSHAAYLSTLVTGPAFNKIIRVNNVVGEVWGLNVLLLFTPQSDVPGHVGRRQVSSGRSRDRITWLACPILGQWENASKLVLQKTCHSSYGVQITEKFCLEKISQKGKKSKVKISFPPCLFFPSMNRGDVWLRKTSI